MKRAKNLYSPTATNGKGAANAANQSEGEPIGDFPCPCCGYLTIPNHGDALAYICPVCCWEIDLFLKSEAEPSDQNHGLSLLEARANYAACGAALPRLKPYCRPPKARELPEIDQKLRPGEDAE